MTERRSSDPPHSSTADRSSGVDQPSGETPFKRNSVGQRISRFSLLNRRTSEIEEEDSPVATPSKPERLSSQVSRTRRFSAPPGGIFLPVAMTLDEVAAHHHSSEAEDDQAAGTSSPRPSATTPTGSPESSFKSAAGSPPDRSTGDEALVLSVDALLDGDNIGKLLQTTERWDFDIFQLHELSNGQPLKCIVMHFVRVYSLDEKLNLNVANLVRFMSKLEKGYHDVPFHCRIHASDVAHGTAYLLRQERVRELITPLDMYSMILAAAMHDFRHPGLTNAFLVDVSDERAILYNDRSVLENYHAASAFRLMLEPLQNPLGTLSKPEYLETRQTMVEAILGTDLKHHFQHQTHFRTLRAADAFDEPQRKDLRTLLAVILHAADVSNLAKPWDLSLKWVVRLFQEQFLQGDKERRLGMTPSPLTDREKTDIPKSEIGFANFMILPYFEELCSFLSEVEEMSEDVVQHIRDNIKVWETQGDTALGEDAAALRVVPASAPAAAAAAPGAAAGEGHRDSVQAHGRRKSSDSLYHTASRLASSVASSGRKLMSSSGSESERSKDASPILTRKVSGDRDSSPPLPTRAVRPSTPPPELISMASSDSAGVAEAPPPCSRRPFTTAGSETRV